MEKISKTLGDHYRKKFLKYGANTKGVDWGDKEWAGVLRQRKMLELVLPSSKNVSLLDVGCGYGALAEVVDDSQLNITYSGIEIVSEMVDAANKKHPNLKFICGDIIEEDITNFDYIVCNGILTQKLTATTLEMNHFANKLIKKMFKHCKIGIAFNIMSTHVNFQKDNLYYRNPAELMAWCMSELTPHVKFDCSYGLIYEYTVFLYKKTSLKNGEIN